MARLPLLVFACLVGLVWPANLNASPFSQLVIFGDSLSDTGNAYHELGTLAMEHPEDYYDGRFSNGPVWSEYLADERMLAPPVANTIDTTYGRNYAFGGAWTHAGFLNFTHWVINDIDEQVSDFINNDGGPTGNELVVIFGGANDLFDEQTNPNTLVNNLTSDINDLYIAGARNFLVVNLPLLGQVPDFLGSADEATLDALSIQFNNLLAASLDNLQGSLTGTDFFRVNAQALITDAINNPATYGFTNVTTPALGQTGIDPDQYLFWDGKHPTTAAHNLLALNASNTIFSALYTLPGDLNLDGYVGLDDLDVILNHWNTHVTPGNPLQGDPTHDGYVGLDDLDSVLNHWNTGTPPPEASSPPTLPGVPEPATFALLGLVALPVLRRHS